MKKMKTATPMYTFLKEGGYLDKGTEVLKLGKKLYRKSYLLKKKQEYRKALFTHSIICTPEQEQLLAQAAKFYGLSVAEYLRHGAICFAQKKFMLPQTNEIQKVLQNLIYARCQIDQIRQKDQSGFFTKSKSSQLESLVLNLEKTVHEAFHNPLDLEEEIKKTLRSHPPFIECLKRIINASEINRTP
jgi:hypothetical protein